MSFSSLKHLLKGATPNQRPSSATAAAEVASPAEAAPNMEQQLQKARAAWLDEMRDFQIANGCVQFPEIPELTEKHLCNCRLLPARRDILRRMKPGGIAAEVGVQTGAFSQAILELGRPAKLHLIDIALGVFSIPEKFKGAIEAGQVELHEGYSSVILQTFPDSYFDFIYIDADHSYLGVKRDIEAGRSKLKTDGYLIFNDYTFWSPAECMPYGVIRAVNELCLEEDWELIYFTFEQNMYCDVALKRRPEGAGESGRAWS